MAKEFDKSLVSSFVPYFANIFSGKKRPRKAVRDVLKHSANKTVAKATGTRGAATRAGAVAAAGRAGARNAASGRVIRQPQVEKVSKTVTNLQLAFLRSQKTSF